MRGFGEKTGARRQADRDRQTEKSDNLGIRPNMFWVIFLPHSIFFQKLVKIDFE